jgi:hypothetical protein
VYYIGVRDKKMENKLVGNKVMFYTGMALIIASVVLLLGNFMGENTNPTILGTIGVIFIGASKFRLLK